MNATLFASTVAAFALTFIGLGKVISVAVGL